jgi:hypothetical protein
MTTGAPEEKNLWQGLAKSQNKKTTIVTESSRYEMALLRKRIFGKAWRKVKIRDHN